MARQPKKALSVAVPQEMRAYLDQMADDEDIALSDAIRDLMYRGRKERDQERSHKLPKAA